MERSTNHCTIATKRCVPWPREKSFPQNGDSWRWSFLGDPGAKFLGEKLGKARRKRKELKQECGWKGGDRGGLAQGNTIWKEGMKKEEKREKK
jgi:hypothetical protein